MAGRIETLLTATGLATLGVISGRAIDMIFPDLKGDELTTFLEFGGQFAVGILAMTEISALLVPPNFQTPIGDGFMWTFFFLNQPRFLNKMSTLFGNAADNIEKGVKKRIVTRNE